MSSPHNGFWKEAKIVAVASMKWKQNPDYECVHHQALTHVRGRVAAQEAKGSTPIDTDRTYEVAAVLARCAFAMIEQWHMTKGAGAWPPNKKDRT